MFCRSLFVLFCFFFWPLCRLLFDLQILITPLVSSNSSVFLLFTASDYLLVSSNSSVFLLFTASDYPFGIFKLFGLSSIYSFWLPFWYLQTLVFFLFSASDYPFGIFKLFGLSSIYSFWLPFWYLQTLLSFFYLQLLISFVNRRKTEEFEDTKRVIRSCK
jgi:hypothetical protein